MRQNGDRVHIRAILERAHGGPVVEFNAVPPIRGYEHDLAGNKLDFERLYLIVVGLVRVLHVPRRYRGHELEVLVIGARVQVLGRFGRNQDNARSATH